MRNLNQVLLIAVVMALTVAAMAAGAGIYKWAATPAIVPTATPTIATPTVAPSPNLTYDLLAGLLYEYMSELDLKSPGIDCSVGFSPYRREDAERYRNYDHTKATYQQGKWTLRNTGKTCDGVESWEMDDATRAIKYLGSSTTP